jgi:transcription antitermination protein NusB
LTDHLIYRGRTAARLGAVQALYQLETEPVEPNQVIGQFISHRFENTIDGVGYESPDLDLFRSLVTGAHDNRQVVDSHIEQILQKGWRIGRLEAVVRALLRVATYELSIDPLTPNAVIINEYVEIAKAFYAVGEVSFVNACLDNLSKKVRPSL